MEREDKLAAVAAPLAGVDGLEGLCDLDGAVLEYGGLGERVDDGVEAAGGQGAGELEGEAEDLFAGGLLVGGGGGRGGGRGRGGEEGLPLHKDAVEAEEALVDEE